MKKLSKEEAQNISPMRQGRHTWLHKALARLEVGEALVINYDEWNGKRTPYRVIGRAAKKLNRKFDYGRMPDGSEAWLVKRVG